MARPNLLFLFPDQWRGDWLGCAGEGIPVETPNIDTLARRGVRFAKARTNSPLCAPARACLATGARFPASGVAGGQDDLPADAVTFFRVLRDSGYAVATCGKNDLRKGAYVRGDPDASERLAALGFTHVREQAGKRDAAVMAVERKSDAYVCFLNENRATELYLGDIADRDMARKGRREVSGIASRLSRHLYTDDFCGNDALALLEELPRDAPWCLWVNFPGPHEPFDPPADLLARYDGVQFPDPVAPGRNDPTDHQSVRRAYAAMITGIDEWVGRIVDTVDARGELERTLIVFSSDHGEMLGDHGEWGKVQPYEGSLRIPLVMAGPKIERGRVSDARAELADIGATLLDATGIEVTPGIAARSLMPVLDGTRPDPEHRSHQYAALPTWRAILFDRFKAVRRSDGRFVLYDLEGASGERQDCAAGLPRTAAFLGQWLAQYPEPPAAGV
jgi:arylsulfatase A-like enzyme